MSTPRTMTLADHIAIETEESVSPIQREVSRAAADAERRKAYLLQERDWWQARAATFRSCLTYADQQLQSVLDELRELS
jgi:arylsulfatase A-like enzyme